ncbi:hypothetical protein BDW74DRAFT_4587 [Aspergillus multicolor]|uniref:BTB/POZ domain-containing protein n=1 Tax=Aspergillus multicolor TaxID=41759 RepID=UPI003CCE26EB
MSDTDSDTSSFTELAGNDIVDLEVGERRFATTRNTLGKESTFFAALLADPDNLRPDGRYFVDADGNLFEHIIQFLRRGTYPLLYDQWNGHDHAMYHALLQESRFFGIAKLTRWLEEKKYVDAVQVVHTAYYSRTTAKERVSTLRSDINVQYFVQSVNSYVCPRGILQHRERGDCGHKCRQKATWDGNAHGSTGFDVVEVQRQVSLDSTLCDSNA